MKMGSGCLTRRELAKVLGLSYSSVRVYERALAGIISPHKGPNRTSFFSVEDVELFRRARVLSKRGYSMKVFAEMLHREYPGTIFERLDRIEKKVDRLVKHIEEERE